jgi:NAD+ kinase
MSPATPNFERIAFVASPIAEAREGFERLAARYGNVAPEAADVIVALGGDGLMLQTLHRFMNTGKPIYGMHRGTVGFLMNEFHPDHLPQRLAKAQVTVIHPLLMRAHDSDGDIVQFHAFNDVFLYRQTYQAARLRILIDGEERLSELVADGVLVATPAGSTAYNLSVQGPIIPISAPLMALTPISPFRPRRWRGALLPDSARPSPTTTRFVRSARSTSRWITASPCRCCSIRGTASMNGFCGSNSGTEYGALASRVSIERVRIVARL